MKNIIDLEPKKVMPVLDPVASRNGGVGLSPGVAEFDLEFSKKRFLREFQCGDYPFSGICLTPPRKKVRSL